MKAITKVVAGLALVAVSSSVLAASASDTIAARHANFKVMGKAMKATGEELRNPTPSVDVIRANAAALATAAAKVKGFFPRGSGPESGAKTEALAAIWQKPTEFGAAADKLTGAVQAYSRAAASGDIGQIKASLGAVGGACKSCHESFREKDS